MSESLQLRLDELRSDYNQLNGRSFAYFFCPILFRDENVSLCKGHVVNLVFPNSTRAWTVQRQDVDNFYGANFESEFVDILYKENRTLGETITDKTLSKKFRPKILLDDKPVDFFVTHNHLPDHFTPVEFNDAGKVVKLGVKMHRDDFLAASGRKWEITIEKDMRLSAMVSLIKSAHLTLFSLLGYRYALSAAGHFVGWQILGEFFLQNQGKAKSEVRKNAHAFFREFAHMVRPVKSDGFHLQGTVTDKQLLVCSENNCPPWAFIVFIKISRSLHSVMIPIFEQPIAIAKFMSFLKDGSDSLDAKLARFERNHWKISKESRKLHWPKTGILYPESCS